MTLTNGVAIARSGLSAVATQTAVISRNVVNGGDILTSRKTANIVTVPGAGVRVMSITRASDSALLLHMLAANSSLGRQSMIVDGLQRLDQTVGDPEQDSSPAALIGKLADAIQIYSAGPQDLARARAAINAAGDVVNALHDATEAVRATRLQADADVASSVDRLNALLAQFEAVNTAIVKGTRAGSDVTDHLDTRDRLLLSISEEIGIRTVSRGDNDMAIYTDGGVTLFDTKARAVTFDRTIALAPGAAGNAVFVDGVPITGNSGGMTSSSGRIIGLVTVRDDISVTYQVQLDEIARGLIEAFAESDQSAIPTLADAPGLFTWPGAPGLPASGVVTAGLAGLIRVNPAVDPLQGGDPALLRDGGIAGPAYSYNTSGSAGFSGRLQGLLDRMGEPRPFDPTAQLNATATIGGFAVGSIGWLQELRKSASAEAEYRMTVFDRSSDALSKATGVNLDEEMTLLLDLERSYQATSRLITAIDSMYQALLEVAG